MAGGGLLTPGISAENVPVSGTLMGDLAYRFKLNKKGTVCLGPFVGFISPGDTELELEDPEDGDNAVISPAIVELSGMSGMRGGLTFTAGGEHVCFDLKVGYMQFGYEITDIDEPGWQIETADGDNEIDFSGPFLQLGISALSRWSLLWGKPRPYPCFLCAHLAVRHLIWVTQQRV